MLITPESCRLKYSLPAKLISVTLLIAISCTTSMRPNRVNHYMNHILTRYMSELTRGAIISINEGQIRLRMLPVVLGDSEHQK